MAALDAVKNFGKVTVSTGYDASATSIALSSGHGANLPAPSTDGNFNLVWWNFTDYADPSDDPNKEIVRCTARSTDTLTVTRAQEGTSGSTKNTANKTYKMILTPTAKTVTDIQTAIQGGTMVYAADAGSSDAYAITLSPVPTAYTTGMIVNFKANTANTGAATLNVNSLGAVTIKKLKDQDLATGDIEAGQFLTCIYDGTNFQMQSQIAQVASSAVTATYRAGENLTANDACTLIDDIAQPYRSNINPNAPNGHFGQASPNQQYYATKFIPRANYSISSIWVFLCKTGLPTDNVILEIRPDASGSPDIAPITNGTSNGLAGSSVYRQDASGIPYNYAFKQHNMTFATAPSVTAGTTYWLVFKRDGAGDNGNYYHTDTLTNVYGDFTSKYFTTTWNVQGWSAYFKMIPASGNRTLSAYQADGTIVHKSRVDGFAQATTTSGNNVTLVQSGDMTGFTGLSPGKRYWLGGAAAIQTNKNTFGGKVGLATSATSLYIDLHHEATAQLLTYSTINNTFDYVFRFNTGFPVKKLRVHASSSSVSSYSLGYMDGDGLGGTGTYWVHRFNWQSGTGNVQDIQVGYLTYLTNDASGIRSTSVIHAADEYGLDIIVTGSSGGNSDIEFLAIAEA